jgi:hypothetical protein
MRPLLSSALTLGLVLAGSVAFAADRVDYVRDVKPILAAHCYACHGALQQKSGLRLDTAKLLRTGGNHGPAIDPGNSAESLLVERVTGAVAPRMPPASAGEVLKARDVALIRAWIDAGAPAPADEKPEADPREHWAFRAPVRPAVPEVKNRAWVRNPIDAFIAAEHARHGLTPQPPAEKRLLLRRVYLDLIGLPPSAAELAAFMADNSADAYEKVVDRLLGSKQYGERWGRHWMDIWRYSDWWGLGAEVRNSQKHVWHWRDWIIESLNADRGYDQMLREMLAADELYPNDLDRLRATGFLVRSYFLFNRNTWLDDTVEHTSKAFLGLTINCARCHDHKFDPIAQADYYRMRAFFEPYQVRMDQLPGEVDLEKDGLPRVFDCHADAPTYLFVRGDEKRPRKERPLSPGVPALLALGKFQIKPVHLPPQAHAPGLRPFVLEDQLRAAERQIAAERAALEQARQLLAKAVAARKNTPVVKKPEDPRKGSLPARPLLQDGFATARPELWQTAAGQWKYESGKLVQKQDGDTRAVLRARKLPPTDFQATFKFSILGGRQWKSVGLTFDVAGAEETVVYLSAYAGGPKLQVSYKQGGGYIYPPEAARAWPVKLGELQTLTVRVRGPLVNVAVGGKHVLAYRLPRPRRKGHLELITYDARAEFRAFELSALPSEFQMVEAAGAKPGPVTVELARAAVVLAEKTLAAAQLQPALLRARAAADRARWQQPPAANARDLVRQAAVAERRMDLAKAEEGVARAQLEIGGPKLAAAQAALAKARKALEAPGEAYTPLRGSLKTLESNTETAASRNLPFPTTSTGRRTALARWITDPKHPLTARVAVNHLWMRHFGKPLVPTVFDFGRKGTPPTHPALLDWLAVELREHGWSMKHLHRLMVTSSTYRMTSSGAGAAAYLKADGENRYYWRMNPVRMQAQVVRDSLLSLAGELDPKMGGPPVPVADAQSRRRSLYFFHSHNEQQKFLAMFDDASVLECYRRAESIVPQQALALENSSLTLSAAEKIAARLGKQLGTAPDREFVRVAFETVLASTPTAAEQAACEEALARLMELHRQGKQPDPVGRARAILVHALLNHNDFITVR